MPHLTIEYSANLESDLDFESLCRTMHAVARSIEDMPFARIRTRLARRDVFEIADQHPDNGFINMTLGIVGGRPVEQLKTAGEKLFAALQEFVADAYAKRPMALSFSIQEIDPELRWKAGNLRQYMADRQKQRE